MDLGDWIIRKTGKPSQEVFPGPGAPVELKDIDGTHAIIKWDADALGMPQPTEAEVAAALALPDLPPVPASIKDYQLIGQAKAEGILDADEAAGWIGGKVPAKVQAKVDQMITDPVKHDELTFFLMGATDFPRYHPNTIALGALFGKDTPQKLDDFFAAAGLR